MKLVILDRDGVINEDSAAFIKSPAEWRPIAGSLEAIVRLKHAGFRVVVASNQSGLARGLLDYDSLFAIHDKMSRMLADLGAHLDGVFFCPHGPDDGCDCRKPAIGLFEDISRRFGGSMAGCPFIGDSRSDLDAAAAAGALPCLVRGDTSRTEVVTDVIPGVRIYDNLAAAADALIQEQSAHAASAAPRPRLT